MWLTLGATLPCLGLGCVSPVNSDGTSTSSKFLAFFKPAKPKPATKVDRNDPTSMIGKQTKPGADLFVTMAQLRESSGEVAEAEVLYQKAIKADPKSLAALMGYAHLEDRRGNLEAATKLYKKAIAKHPTEIAPYNDLGLCFHRRGMLNESAQTLRKAVELQPDGKLYHNNLAMVLVDQESNDEALDQLLLTGPSAAAHYNLACLLYRKGDETAALEHFQLAAAEDPSMRAAQKWIAKLAPRTSESRADLSLAGRSDRQATPKSGPQRPAAEVGAPATAELPTQKLPPVRPERTKSASTAVVPPAAGNPPPQAVAQGPSNPKSRSPAKSNTKIASADKQPASQPPTARLAAGESLPPAPPESAVAIAAPAVAEAEPKSFVLNLRAEPESTASPRFLRAEEPSEPEPAVSSEPVPSEPVAAARVAQPTVVMRPAEPSNRRSRSSAVKAEPKFKREIASLPAADAPPSLPPAQHAAPAAPLAPVADPPTPPASAYRVQFPVRRRDMAAATDAAAPLPEDGPVLEVPSSADEVHGGAAVIVPAIPNHYDR